MDLSTKQLNEIECLDYFALANCDYKDNTVEGRRGIFPNNK